MRNRKRKTPAWRGRLESPPTTAPLRRRDTLLLLVLPIVLLLSSTTTTTTVCSLKVKRPLSSIQAKTKRLSSILPILHSSSHRPSNLDVPLPLRFCICQLSLPFIIKIMIMIKLVAAAAEEHAAPSRLDPYRQTTHSHTHSSLSSCPSGGWWNAQKHIHTPSSSSSSSSHTCFDLINLFADDLSRCRSIVTWLSQLITRGGDGWDMLACCLRRGGGITISVETQKDEEQVVCACLFAIVGGTPFNFFVIY